MKHCKIHSQKRKVNEEKFTYCDLTVYNSDASICKNKQFFIIISMIEFSFFDENLYYLETSQEKLKISWNPSLALPFLITVMKQIFN